MFNCSEYLILESNNFTGSFMSEMGLLASLKGINTGFNNMPSLVPYQMNFLKHRIWNILVLTITLIQKVCQVRSAN